MKTTLLRLLTTLFLSASLTLTAQISIDTFSVSPQGNYLACTSPVLSVDSQSNALNYIWKQNPQWSVAYGAVSSDTGYFPDVLFSPIGTPYALFLDGGTNRYNVKYFDGNNWVTFGTPNFTPANAAYGSFMMYNGDIYVAFKDPANGNRASVMYCNGSTWWYLGTPGFSSGAANYEEIVADPATGYIYVAYQDVANGNRTTVMCFDGFNWSSLGAISPGGSDFQEIAINDSGVVYVAYEDWTLGNSLTVQKWENFTWSVVGSPGFTAATNYQTPLRFDDDNTPYIAYMDAANSNYVSVRKFDGASWVYVGMPGYSGEIPSSYSLDMEIDACGLPYVSYCETGGILNVKRWTGLSWVNIGDPNSAPGGTRAYPALTIDGNGNPNLIYFDGLLNWNIYMQTYNGTDVAQSTTTYTPLEAGDYTAMVYSTTGKVAYALNIVHGELIDHPETIAMSSSLNVSFCVEGTISATTQSCSNATVEWIMNPMWDTVGTTGFSLGNATDVNLDFGPGNVPFVVYQDAFQSVAGVVLKYDGSAWVNLGSSLAVPTGAGSLDIIVGADSLPWISFRDNAASSKTSVMKYDGSSWGYVGLAGFSDYQSQSTSIALDSRGTPYVVYAEGFILSYISVMKWDGSAWVDVGASQFAGGNSPEICIDSTDTPYLIFEDAMNGNKATVLKFDGTNWVAVGAPGFTAGSVDTPNLELTSGGELIAVYIDQVNGNKLGAMKYSGSVWLSLGVQAFSADYVGAFDLTLDGADVPYVACSMYPNGNASVYRYDGTAWQLLGASAFSAGPANYPAIEIDTAGIPLVVFCDLQYQGTLSAMKFDGAHVASATLMYNVQTSGTYITSVSLGENGTLATNSIVVTINPLPDTAVTSVNFPLTLTAQEPNATYQWINCATGLAISGATLQTFVPFANGNYCVAVTTQAGCTDTSSCNVVTGVGIDESTTALIYNVYPNPANEILVIETQQACNIQIVDPAGRVVLADVKQSGKKEMNVRPLSSGVYFIHVTENETGMKAVQQIIIQ